MLKTIPTWIWYVVAGAALIAAIVAGAEYLDAATSLLPGGEDGGER
jgi:hypothetical protein